VSKFYSRVEGGSGYFSNREMFVVPRQDFEFWRTLVGVENLGFSVCLDEMGGIYFKAEDRTPFNGLTYFLDLSRYMRAAFWHDLARQEGKKDQNFILQTKEGRKAANRLFKQIAMDDGNNAAAVVMFGAIKTHTRWFK
jgi:hypothetical protein